MKTSQETSPLGLGWGREVALVKGAELSFSLHDSR